MVTLISRHGQESAFTINTAAKQTQITPPSANIDKASFTDG